MHELLRLARENNIMLRAICSYLRNQNNADDFTLNVIANIISNKFIDK